MSLNLFVRFVSLAAEIGWEFYETSLSAKGVEKTGEPRECKKSMLSGLFTLYRLLLALIPHAQIQARKMGTVAQRT